MITDKQREKVVKWCVYLNEHQSQIGYGQDRPFPLLKEPELEAIINEGEFIDRWDCYASTAEIFYIVGLKDPSGFNYNGLGNTDTLLEHLPHYTEASHARPGALVVFGADLPLSEQHVAIVTKQGDDPELFSHGEAFECRLLSLSEEQTAHSGSTVFMDVTSL
jgi:hypothetical protein